MRLTATPQASVATSLATPAGSGIVAILYKNRGFAPTRGNADPPRAPLVVAFGYAGDGRKLACIYEMIDEFVILPIPAYEVE
ncbi:MAG: hypothetical protein WD851_07035 [Pirellulales bacterium]